MLDLCRWVFFFNSIWSSSCQEDQYSQNMAMNVKPFKRFLSSASMHATHRTSRVYIPFTLCMQLCFLMTFNHDPFDILGCKLQYIFEKIRLCKIKCFVLVYIIHFFLAKKNSVNVLHFCFFIDQNKLLIDIIFFLIYQRLMIM